MRVLLLIVLLLFSGTGGAQQSILSKASFEQAAKRYVGKKWMTLIWSLDCPPCFDELATLAALVKEEPKLRVLLVNADSDAALAEQRQQVIEEFGLHTLTHLNFAPGSEALSRQIIDDNWFGELPRSYFYDEAGGRKAKSGLIDEKLLRHWLL